MSYRRARADEDGAFLAVRITNSEYGTRFSPVEQMPFRPSTRQESARRYRTPLIEVAPSACHQTSSLRYRGAGRPRDTYMERLMRRRTQRSAIDRMETAPRNQTERGDPDTDGPRGSTLRQRRLSGVLKHALEAADVKGLRAPQTRERPKRKGERARRGQLFEVTAQPSKERAASAFGRPTHRQIIPNGHD